MYFNDGEIKKVKEAIIDIDEENAKRTQREGQNKEEKKKLEAQIAKLENNNNEIQEKAANELKKKILTVETDTITTSIKNIAELYARITIVKDEAKKQLLNNINEFSINETFGGQDAEVDDKFLILVPIMM